MAYLEAEKESSEIEYSLLISNENIESKQFLMKPKLAAKKQKKDAKLKGLVNASIDQYELKEIEKQSVITQNGKLLMQESLQEPKKHGIMTY